MLGGGMIVKMFKRGAGGGSGPVNYLLGNKRDREGATLLRGDPDQIKALIDSSKYAQKYTSGVLSFEEKDIPEATKQRLMDSFERALLPALDKDQYSVLWVEHRDKNRLELNFVVPNLELQTGKRLQVYFHAQDRYRMRDWQTIQNIENGFEDPDDPLKRQLVTLPNNLPENRKEAQLAITHGLKELVDIGEINSRSDVVRALTDAGFTVARETKSSISIAAPDGGKNIRLTGALYEREFSLGHGASLESEITREGAAYRESRFERLSRARASFGEGFRRKHDHNQQRYKRPERGLDQSLEQPEFGVVERSERADRHVQHEQRNSEKSPLQELGNNADRVGVSPVLGWRGPLVSGQDDQRELGRNSPIEHAEKSAGKVQRGSWEGRGRSISGVAEKERDHEHVQIGQGLSSRAVGEVNDRTRADHAASVAGHAEEFQSRSGRFRAFIQGGFNRFVEHIHAARATLGTRARSIREGTAELAKHVQSSISGERPLERASERLNRSNGDFNQAVKQFERVIEHRKELEIQRARELSQDKGMHR
jgi:hypothetical protein